MRQYYTKRNILICSFLLPLAVMILTAVILGGTSFAGGVGSMFGTALGIILIQSVVPGAASVLKQLTKLNSVCMPLRYCWVFVAYIALRKAYDRIHADYRFVKKQGVAYFFGWWCLIITLACCLMGMYDKDPFTMALNIITPVVLTALGLIMPAIAKRQKKQI